MTLSLGFVAGLLASYAIGGIPVGWLIARRQGIDISKRGSGGIGFTNTFRVLGRETAIIVIMCDVTKGASAVAIAWLLVRNGGIPYAASVYGIAAMIGHSWSPVIRVFSRKWGGGRSVATALGVLLMLSPLAGLAGVVTVVAVAATTRYVSLGTLCAIPVAVLVSVLQYARFGGSADGVAFAVVAAVFLVVRHIENIRRLASGTERRWGERA